MTTEDERAERIRRLQERRAASAARPVEDTQPIDQAAVAREERIRALQERRGSGRTAPEPAAAPVDRAPRTAAPKRKPRTHRAEASRIFVAGAGVTLTFSLMALMARADQASAEEPIDPTPTTVGNEAFAMAAPTTQAPVTSLAPATASTEIPVILTPVQRRTTIVVTGGGGGGGSKPASSGGSSGGGGGTPVASTGGGGGGGTVATTPPPPPPPPPPPASSSNGSG